MAEAGVLDAFVLLLHTPLPSFSAVPRGSLNLLERMRGAGSVPTLERGWRDGAVAVKLG